MVNTACENLGQSGWEVAGGVCRVSMRGGLCGVNDKCVFTNGDGSDSDE